KGRRRAHKIPACLVRQQRGGVNLRGNDGRLAGLYRQLQFVKPAAVGGGAVGRAAVGDQQVPVAFACILDGGDAPQPIVGNASRELVGKARLIGGIPCQAGSAEQLDFRTRGCREPNGNDRCGAQSVERVGKRHRGTPNGNRVNKVGRLQQPLAARTE